MDAETSPAEAASEELLILVDTRWEASEGEPDPPVEAVLGAWPVTAGGARGRFESNPVYRPSTPESPLDPLDAVLRAATEDKAFVEHLPAALRDVVLSIAVDEQEVALVRPAPDGVPSVLVTTAHGHRSRLDVPRWLDVTLSELAAALPAQGVDVLLNPGSAASMRVLADAIRDTARED
jgi:hypothetical protein